MPLKVLFIQVLLLLVLCSSSTSSAESHSVSTKCKLQNGRLEPLFNARLTYLQKIKVVNRKIARLTQSGAPIDQILRQKQIVKKLKGTRKRLLPQCKETSNEPDEPPHISPSLPPEEPTPPEDNAPDTSTPTASPTPTETPTPTLPYTMSVTPIFKQYGTSSSCNPNIPFIRATSGEINEMAGYLPALRPSPRLLVETPDRFATLSSLRASDAILNGYVARMFNHITYNLASIVVPAYTTDDALMVDGRLLENLVLHYALAYRLTGNITYLSRAKESMFAAIDDYPTWGIGNSTLHIATSFVVAVSVGKDWLYDSLTADEKIRARSALLSKFVTPVLDMYRTGCKDAWSCATGETHYWWLWSGMNLNIVSHTASALAALSIADTDPTIAAELLANSVKGLKIGMKYFTPDGAGCEGPDYQGYALRYAIYALTSLDRALGNSFGLWNEDGMSASSEYLMNFDGGWKKAFNFGDATSVGKTQGEIQTICFRFSDIPSCALVHDSLKERAPDGTWTRVEPQSILYYSPPPADTDSLISSAPSSRLFLSSNEVSFEPPGADGTRHVRVAISGGINKWNHNDQGDLGSIIAYVNNKPLVKDYGYVSHSFYSGNTLGHSTLAFNETLQGPSEKMGIVTYSPHPTEPFAILKHYGENPLLERWSRGIQVGPTWFRLRDEFETKNGGTLVRWSVQSDAEATIINGGKSLELSFSGENYRADIIEPNNSVFSLGPMNLSSNETLDSSNKRLSIDAIGTGDPQSIEVIFYDTVHGKPAVILRPLVEWIN